MEKISKTPKIKICGITSERDADCLNEAGADYAGFVFYEKSRRYVSIQKAWEIASNLEKCILKVAVVVNPALELIREIEKMKFDILQVHGAFPKEIRTQVEIPVWRAVNITRADNLMEFFEKEADEGTKCVTGYVADGAVCGGGKTFDWEALKGSVWTPERGKERILAGGLTAENVKSGIAYFRPDVVDVSSGVEEEGTKSREKIIRFIRKVREDE